MMTMLPRDMLVTVSTYVGGSSFVSLCVTSKSWNQLLQHSCRYEEEMVAHRKERVARFRAQFKALDISIWIAFRGYQVSVISDPERVNLDEPPELREILEAMQYVDFSDLSRLTDAQVASVKARCDSLKVTLLLGLDVGRDYVSLGSSSFTDSIARKEALLCENGSRFLRLFRQHHELVTEEIQRLKLPSALASLYHSDFIIEPRLNQAAVDQVKNFSIDALRQLVSRIVALEAEISAMDIGFTWCSHRSGTEYRPFKASICGLETRRLPLNVDVYVKQVSEEVREFVMRPSTLLLERRTRMLATVAELQRLNDEGLARLTTKRLRAILKRDVTDRLEKARVYADQTDTLIQLDDALRLLWRTVLRPIAGPPPARSFVASGGGSGANKQQRLF